MLKMMLHGVRRWYWPVYFEGDVDLEIKDAYNFFIYDYVDFDREDDIDPGVERKGYFGPQVENDVNLQKI